MTKPNVTRARGNGGIRENKVEKRVAEAALPTRSLMTMRGPCGWQEGCVWNGLLIEGLCAEHRSEKLRRARVARWQAGRSRPTPPPGGLADHSAPWACASGRGGCEVCTGKPTYEEWVHGRRHEE